MEKQNTGVVERGMRQVGTVGVGESVTRTKPWISARPAIFPGTRVSTAPTALRTAGELCRKPDLMVTQSHPAQVAARPAAVQVGGATVAFPDFSRPDYTQAVGSAIANADVPTIKGSIRPAPPG